MKQTVKYTGVGYAEKTAVSAGRLLSLDVLRGFDMLFIMGGGPLVLSVCAALGAPNCAFANQFRHVAWEGFRFEDLIFPLFLFIAGVSFPFSKEKRISQGASRRSLCLHAVRRGVTLVFLGIVYNGFFSFDFARLRFFGVLQLIGFAWMMAALQYIFFGLRTRAALAVFLLVGPWLLFNFIGTPDFPGANPFSPEGNIGCWIDRTVFESHIYQKLFDPEGTAGLLPSIVTPMLGMFAGDVLKNSWTGERKTICLLAMAVSLSACGWLLSLSVPVVKALWSSSFVLVAGSYSVAMLAVFYWVVDVKGWKGWTFFFKVIGINSITVYMAQRIVGFKSIDRFFFGGLASFFPSAWGEVVLSAGYIAVCWLFLLFLYRRNICLRV